MNISKEVKDLLMNQRLCMMATCLAEEPYLSLMNFTYLENESKVILSTRKNSKKYFNVQNNKNVSLLVFSESEGISVTLLGTASTLLAHEEDVYKAQHMKKNNMPQFILGDDIGLIIFEIERIVVSNYLDQVVYTD
ncbi:MAG TPA: pyridoxamine 5'-phosphate oxidase family protein [Clostridiales bacterium UBA8960]|nr:pyridoxamine 5'-phosphate oxidase family protein [Clostridiales bacterium UBA8960]